LKLNKNQSETQKELVTVHFFLPPFMIMSILMKMLIKSR